MKQKVYSIIFVTILAFFMISSILIEDKSISLSERRPLQQFPEFHFNELFDGNYFSDLSDYLVEQFPFRDSFKQIKGFINTNIFKKTEDNGVFIKDNNIYQLDETVDKKSLSHITDLIMKIKNQYLKTTKVYYGIIPDKNYYLEDSIPKLDYSVVEEHFKTQLKDMQYINLFDTLSLDSYYSTDIHWKQEYLKPVKDEIQKNMNLEITEMPSASKRYDNFYGALYGRIASSLKPDTLTYLSNDIINNAEVYNFEKNIFLPVYNENDLDNIDSYDIYLSGASALLVIENKEQTNNKELILFRDSFSSSLAPLLIENYSKITMIDLRYINSSLLNDIDFLTFQEDQDVLFLYSTPVINQSFTLK